MVAGIAMAASSVLVVEEKFRKYFGYLARCEEKTVYGPLQNRNFGSKFDENAEIGSAKI